MKPTRANILFFLGLAIPALFVFKAFFLPGPLAWGDAPFFYSEGLAELSSRPYAWIARGNNFGGFNNFLWIYPLMVLYGSLHTLFGLGNGEIVRILFYFPSVILAFATPIAFTRYLGYSRAVQFFASLLYGLNTYFLLLVDGGQVSVALAYGIFPLVLVFLHGLINIASLAGFFGTLALFWMLVIVEIRFAAISVITVLFWVFVEHFISHRTKHIRQLGLLLLLLIATAGLSSYWIVPILKVGEMGMGVDVSNFQPVSFLNPLLLFQPHWPLNEFGKVVPPPFYFVAVPFLVFGNLLRVKEKRVWGFAFLVLLFAFFTKGEVSPLGEWYGWIVKTFPFGGAFRDSTKFFTPLLLFSGVLIGITVDSFKKHSRFLTAFSITTYVCLLFLIYPAILGNLNGVLAGRSLPREFETVHQRLVQEEGFFRTLWFPERSPFAFHTEVKPALDAKKLVETRPFASINVGSFDAFNFLHNEQFAQWFDILGIKYLLFSGDPRKVELNEEEQKNWDNLLSLVANIEGIERIDLGINFPVYRVSETKPHIFGVDKLVAVVGGDDIYQKLKEADDGFSMGNQGFVFFEDGRLDPTSLQGIAPESVVLVFNKKDELNLAASFLQRYFVSPADATLSEWAVRDSSEYLRWKYELLINGVETHEFDYGKGIAFSSQDSEVIKFAPQVEQGGEYILALRSLSGEGSSPLKVTFGGKTWEIARQPEQFTWFVSDPISLEVGEYEAVLENPGGFQAVNVGALIPKEEWNKTQELLQQFTGHFDVVRIEDDSDVAELTRILGDRWVETTHEQISPVWYKVAAPENAHWVILTDSYNTEWKLKKGAEAFSALPFYSMVNGFYVEPDLYDAEIVFGGQKGVRWGIYWSLITLFSLAVIFLWFYPKKR